MNKTSWIYWSLPGCLGIGALESSKERREMTGGALQAMSSVEQCMWRRLTGTVMEACLDASKWACFVNGYFYLVYVLTVCEA